MGEESERKGLALSQRRLRQYQGVPLALTVIMWLTVIGFVSCVSMVIYVLYQATKFVLSLW